MLDGLGRTNIHYRIGDGTLGWPEDAPFDRVLVTAGAPAFPSALFAQLARGGILVAPLGNASDQELIQYPQARGEAGPADDHALPVRQADRRRRAGPRSESSDRLPGLATPRAARVT